MEFRFNVHRALGEKTEEDAIVRWTAKELAKVRHHSGTHNGLAELIDTMGVHSAKAQALPRPITSVALMAGTDQVLYIAVSRNRVLGILKVGTKKLFIRNDSGAFVEISPMCVLDFYVHESCQRAGIGKYLFDHVTDELDLPPSRFAYDRPSPKLLAFLRKHYGLSDYTPQSNNFVVYRQYFDRSPAKLPQQQPQKDQDPSPLGDHAVNVSPLLVEKRAVPMARTAPFPGMGGVEERKVGKRQVRPPWA